MPLVPRQQRAKGKREHEEPGSSLMTGDAWRQASMAGITTEEGAKRPKRQYWMVHNEGKLSKCCCGWIRFRRRLPGGRVVEFCLNRECPCFDDRFMLER